MAKGLLLALLLLLFKQQHQLLQHPSGFGLSRQIENESSPARAPAVGCNWHAAGTVHVLPAPPPQETAAAACGL